MKEREIELRGKLRAHGRQLGCSFEDGICDIGRLADEIAYEHWHRMFFARYLAENDLLIYHDGDGAIPISINECEELASDEGARSGWEFAGRCAALMLPQIFRAGSPVFDLSFPPELQREMEISLASLPPEIFGDPGSLDAAYRFWEGSDHGHDAARRHAEQYKIDFLMDNLVGAQWVARASGLLPGAEEQLRSAENEEELRKFFAISGKAALPLKYMRFVRTDAMDDSRRWAPAVGWPDDGAPGGLSSFKAIDPCCGAGQLLVSLLRALTPVRMELEGLSAREAVDAVLKENISGVEQDARCVELAVFALALAAWKYPGAGGYRKLPELNIACSGLSVGAEKKAWENLARGKHNLRIALGMMYETFRDAPAVGGLIDPARSDASAIARWETGSGEELRYAIEEALRTERGDEEMESAMAAQGLAKTAELLSARYDLVAANLPSLPRAKQDERLQKFCAENYPQSKGDLAEALADRSIRLCKEDGAACFVMPKNWLTGEGYRKFRDKLPDFGEIQLAARLCDERTALLVMSARASFFPGVSENSSINCVDEDKGCGCEEKAMSLRSNDIARIRPADLSNTGEKPECSPLRRRTAKSNGDPARFLRQFWEFAEPSDNWVYLAGGTIELADIARTLKYSDDTHESRCSGNSADWSFHGHPRGASVETVLQVAVARLLGYRWPAESDGGPAISPEAREWTKRCADLARFASDDGIVCIPSSLGEPPCADRLLEVLAASYGDAWSNDTLVSLLGSVGCDGKNLDFWLRGKFFAQHCKLFKNRPFIWHVWDGLPDGFSALLNYHKLDSNHLKTLIYSHLGDWISRARQDDARGAGKRLEAAERLKKSLERILEGEAPYDIFIRWKPVEEQPIGWAPDIEDGIAVNIRPFAITKLDGATGACVLRKAPNIPQYDLGPRHRGKRGDRFDCHHLKLEEKRCAAEKQFYTLPLSDNE
jgi:hypothetical protein